MANGRHYNYICENDIHVKVKELKSYAIKPKQVMVGYMLAIWEY